MSKEVLHEDFKILKFIEYLDEKFNQENKQLEQKEQLDNEIEYKCFLEGEDGLIEKDEEKIEKFHNNLQGKLEEEFQAEIIFYGKIKDSRYYDTKNKETSILDENGYFLVRVREQEENGKKKNIFTVKKEYKEKFSREYEKVVKKDFGEKELVKKYGLIHLEDKESEKTRIEYKFEIDVDGKNEEVKIAFDNYLDENNKIIPKFFEVEGKSEEAVEKVIEKINNWFPEDKLKITTGGSKKVKEELIQENILIDFNNIKISLKSIRGQVLESIKNLLENQSIYISINELLDGIENEKEFIYNKDLKNSIKKLLEEQIEKTVNEDSLFGKFFYRVISNEKAKNNPRKKFFDKFEREYSGYVKSFLYSVVKDYKNNLEKSDENINKSRILKKIILQKLDMFLKSIFMLDDSLTKENLQKVLDSDSENIKKSFQDFQKNILTIYNKTETLPNIWGKGEEIIDEGYNDNELNNIKLRRQLEGGKNGRLLNRLVTTYSRAFANSVKEGGEIGNNIKVQEGIERIENNQFEYLSKQFSFWLNDPDRDLEYLETLKSLFLENIFHIYLLEKKGLAFGNYGISHLNFEEAKKIIIPKLTQNNGEILFNEDNFLFKEEGPELFKYFIENIDKDNEILSNNIFIQFKNYNRNYNSNIAKKTNEREKNNKFEKIKNKQIDFNFWKNLKIEDRIFYFENNILGINKKGFYLNLVNKKRFNNFLKYEYSKNNYLLDNEGYKNYKLEVENQIAKLGNYFSDKKFLKMKSKEEQIKYLLENDINSFHLLVSLFQYNLKAKYAKKEKGKKLNRKGYNLSQKEEIEEVKKLTLYSETFSEKLLNNLGEEIYNSDKFISHTSSVYNTSLRNKNRLIELHDRIGNDKAINVSNNFYFENSKGKFSIKDFPQLYIFDNNNSYDEYREWLDVGMETVRDLKNGDFDKVDNDYLNELKKIGFPIKNGEYLDQLLEFQKYVYKIGLPYINKLSVNNNENKNKLKEILNNSISDKKDFHVADSKTLGRSLEKTIIKGGVLEEVSDGNRATVYGEDFEDLLSKSSNLIKDLYNNSNIKNIRFEDRIGNLFKKPIRENAYRDAKIYFTDNDGNTYEVQFQLRPYYKIKTGDLKINSEGLLSEYNINLKNKLVEENILFTDLEKEILKNYLEATNIKIPQSFINLYDFENIKYQNIGDIFNADYTYKLERTVGNAYPNINKKLKKLDRIMFDIANGKLARKEYERINELSKK